MRGYCGLAICGRSRLADMEGRLGLHDLPELAYGVDQRTFMIVGCTSGGASCSRVST